MAEKTLPFVNVAMWSGGDYSTATKGATDVIDGAGYRSVAGQQARLGVVLCRTGVAGRSAAGQQGEDKLRPYPMS